MGIYGRYCRSWEEANYAACVGIPLDGGYPHIHFTLLAFDDATVTLKSHGNGEKMQLVRLSDEHGDYAHIVQAGTYELLFRMPPGTFRVCPFVGERF